MKFFKTDRENKPDIFKNIQILIKSSVKKPMKSMIGDNYHLIYFACQLVKNIQLRQNLVVILFQLLKEWCL